MRFEWRAFADVNVGSLYLSGTYKCSSKGFRASSSGLLVCPAGHCLKSILLLREDIKVKWDEES